MSRTCGARTATGGRCRNRIGSHGGRCWQHAGQRERDRGEAADPGAEWHSPGLSPKQAQAVETLAGADPGTTHEQAAELVGVSRRTIIRWWGERAFAAAVVGRRRELSRADYGAVVHALTREAKAGDVPAIRTWLEHHGELRHQVGLDVEGHLSDDQITHLFAALDAAGADPATILAASEALGGGS